MTRTITVKGIGAVSAKADCVELSMSLDACHKEYDKAMDIASTNIQNLTEALISVGFEKESIKTTSFDVHTKYDSIRDKNGNYKRIFEGYEVEHDLKLSFEFKTNRLSKTLSSISNCLSNPEVSVKFTTKDTNAMNDEMLRSATINAKRKAEILCNASGVLLGNLISINYNWGELNIYSKTEYICCEESGIDWMTKPMEIEPEDIDVKDTATFIWEII